MARPDSPSEIANMRGSEAEIDLPYSVSDEQPLLITDDPYVQDTIEDSRDLRYAPPDRFNISIILMVILGMGTAFAWSFFVTATKYFQYSFRNLTDPQQPTTYQTLFETSLAVISTACGCIGLLLSTFLTRYICLRYRVYVGFLVIALAFTMTTVMATMNTDSWQGRFFGVTMGNVFLINLANSIASGGLFGMIGCLPVKLTTALMIGQPAAGIVVVIAQILSLIGGDGSPDSIRSEATGYFASAVSATVFCLIAFAVLIRLPVIRYYMENKDKKVETGQIEQLDRSLGSSLNTGLETSDSTVPSTETSLKEAFPMKIVFRRIWKTALSLILNFFVSIAVFPALTTTVHSLHEANDSMVTNDLFLPLACFLVFNIGDLAGRWAHGLLQLPTPHQANLTLTVSLARLAFIPLFMLCNNQPKSHLPVVFGDGGFVVLIALLAVTNGYIGNLCMMYGPKLVPHEAAETTGALMGLCLNVGLLLGSVFSFFLVYFL